MNNNDDCAFFHSSSTCDVHTSVDQQEKKVYCKEPLSLFNKNPPENIIFQQKNYLQCNNWIQNKNKSRNMHKSIIEVIDFIGQ